jgi:hypothetical protein
MNICYLDFWPGFDSNSNWFNLLFSDYFDGKQLNFNCLPQDADIIVYSCFGIEHYKYLETKAIKIFFTGENQRPSEYCDYSLSFDFDSNGGKNLRLPLWYLYINWWNIPNFEHSKIMKDDLFKQWDPEEVCNRESFCSIVIGNLVQNRIDVARKMNEINPVHGYGSVFGNYFSGNKIDLIKKYKYNICFENTIQEGYVTEKLLEAKVAGCIPIYYGHPAVSKDFNEKGFINYYNYNDISSFFDYIKRLEKDKDLCYNIINQKIFNKEPSLDFIFDFLDKIIKEK